jgi:hypothetical protein
LRSYSDNVEVWLFNADHNMLIGFYDAGALSHGSARLEATW